MDEVYLPFSLFLATAVSWWLFATRPDWFTFLLACGITIWFIEIVMFTPKLRMLLSWPLVLWRVQRAERRQKQQREEETAQ